MEFGTDDNTSVAEKSKQTLSKKPSSENNSKANKLVQGEEDKIEAAAAAAFPSKLVAMHKVRWNLNQGSENLLCFGGAAGILRCQEIDINNT